MIKISLCESEAVPYVIKFWNCFTSNNYKILSRWKK